MRPGFNTPVGRELFRICEDWIGCSVVAIVPVVNISSAVKVNVAGISVVSFTSGVPTGPDLGRSGRKGGVVLLVSKRSRNSVFRTGLLIRSG